MANKGKSLDEKIGNLVNLSTLAFEDHRIVTAEPRRWLLKGNHGITFWVEIVVLSNSKLLVHGDIDAVIFAYGGKSYTPAQLVQWIGSSNLAYAKEKASIGIGHQVVEEVDTDLAIWELCQLIDDAVEYEDKSLISNRHHIEAAIERLQHGENVDVVAFDLYDEGIDPELVGSLGRIVSARVVYAHAAVKKLDFLLRKQDDNERRHSEECKQDGASSTQSSGIN